MDAEGRVVAIYGAVPTAWPNVGSVWLLASDDLPIHRMSFLRHSKRLLTDLHRDFSVLANFVDERNVDHLKWLDWLGFTFVERYPEFGPEKRPFIEVARVAA